MKRECSMKIEAFIAPVLFVGAMAIGQLSAAASLPQPVKTDLGAVSGTYSATTGITAFKGIPYATPPVGDLRWKPTVPATKWTGVLKADHFGANCVQRPRPVMNGQTPEAFQTIQGSVSEDCLFLNVWTPAKSATEKLPVMVWIHGGGYSGGSGSIPMFDGEELARKGVVVITINYRLGLMGFLALKELDAESKQHVSGNYGILDMIESLKWISRNIAGFGGDPKNVTIFGESSGGSCVHHLTATPLAKGLFQRGISESGTFYARDPEGSGGPSSMKTLAEAEAQDETYLHNAGIDSLAKLRAMTVEQILALPRERGAHGDFYGAVIDGYVYPDGYFTALNKGNVADVPYILGGNTDEGGGSPHPVSTVAEFQENLKRKFGDKADEAMKLYPATTDAEAAQAKNTLAVDYGRMSKYLWAQAYAKVHHSPVYIYSWNHTLPGPNSDEEGANHTSEITYVFNSLAKAGPDRPFVQADKDVADKMTTYWTNFAKTGDPNGKGLPVWPVSTPDKKVEMVVGDNDHSIPPVSTEARFEFLKKFMESQPAW